MTLTGPKVTFLPIQIKQDKIRHIVQLSQSHFVQKNPFYILTHTDAATEYIDKLLWETPKHSFLPHGLGETIDIGQAIPEETYIILNTTPLPCQKIGATHIYEFAGSSVNEMEVKEKISYYKSIHATIIG